MVRTSYLKSTANVMLVLMSVSFKEYSTSKMQQYIFFSNFKVMSRNFSKQTALAIFFSRFKAMSVKCSKQTSLAIFFSKFKGMSVECSKHTSLDLFFSKFKATYVRQMLQTYHSSNIRNLRYLPACGRQIMKTAPSINTFHV